MTDARRTITLGMLAAAAFVLMVTIQIPIIPGASFLKYDPSDAVCLVAALAFGPGAGVLVVLVKDLLFTVFRGGSPFGPLADFIAASTFVAATSWVFRRMAMRGLPGRLMAAAAAGTVARVLVMIPVNFVILSLEFAMPPARIAGLLLPAIIPFNAAKALLNAVLALLVVRPALRAFVPGLRALADRDP